MNISEALKSRNDISLFITHLSREYNSKPASKNLISIIKSGVIKSRSTFGLIKNSPYSKRILNTQKCVCFTETPLDYIKHHFCIENRRNKFGPYGIAIIRKDARITNINPVWYVDKTAGHDWEIFKALMSITKNLPSRPRLRNPFLKISPFIDFMSNYSMPFEDIKVKCEFWWEREWRHVGNYFLNCRYLGLCPASEIKKFEKITEHEIKFVDPNWSISEMIEHLDKGKIKREVNWTDEQYLAKLAGYLTKDLEII